jgi:hypothetical protein
VPLINEKGLAKARFGLVGIEESLSLKEWADIAAGLPEAQWQTRTAAAMRLRQRKDRWELAALCRSALAVAGALDAVPHIARPGMTTRQLAAAVDRELRRAAAEDVRILIAGGPQCALSLHPPDDQVLQNGDPVMLYAAAEVQRHWAEAAARLCWAAHPRLSTRWRRRPPRWPPCARRRRREPWYPTSTSARRLGWRDAALLCIGESLWLWARDRARSRKRRPSSFQAALSASSKAGSWPSRDGHSAGQGIALGQGGRRRPKRR